MRIQPTKEVGLALARPRLPSALRIRAAGALPAGDPLRQVRWILLGFSAAGAALLMVVLLADARPGHLLSLVAAAGLPCLVAKWFDEYRERRHPLWWDGLEGLAIAVVGIALGSALAVLLLLLARVASRATQALGSTRGRLARAVHRESSLRQAIVALGRVDAEEALRQAAVDTITEVLSGLRVTVTLALGSPPASRIVATSHGAGRPIPGERPIDLHALTEEQRCRLHAGDLQLTGDELTAVWPADAGPRPEGVFLAELPLACGEGGLVVISGEVVPDIDRITVLTLVEHIALRLEAAAMSRELQHRRDDERESETNFRRLFEANPQPMWLYDMSTLRFLVVNDAAIIQYGYTRDEFLAMRVDDICASTIDLHASRRASRRRREVREESQHRTKEGMVIDVQVESSALMFEAREVVLMLARDVTDERELHHRLEHQTLHDLLTGLPNRRLLETHVRRALARAERQPDHLPAMLVLDLDGFKTINDTLGHALGDRVIAAVAERLETSLRPGDTASRFGGDEFAVLLEDTSGADDARVVAERLVAEIQRPFSIDGRSVAVSASVGIALPHPGHSGIDDLVGDADIAMYVAKSQGTGCCVLFQPEHRTALLDRLTMQEELGAAVQDGDLTVHYQPQLELSTGRVVAVEALVRWCHRSRGMIAPDVFIPVAEQMGLVPAIDTWVLRTACAQLRQWSDEGLPAMRMAVNLSGSDLERADLVDVVRRALVDAMLDPWQLELELTESVAVGQTESAVARLAALRAMGVRIAIDDFGTGYSMFSRLRDLPVDRLKVDRSFVTDISSDDDARAIVGSTVLMGHALGLDIVAEGVEDAATLAILQEMRCDTAQGYHFGRPLPADELSAWLRHRLTATSAAAG